MVLRKMEHRYAPQTECLKRAGFLCMSKRPCLVVCGAAVCLPGASASLWLERDVSGPWRFHWTYTQRAWLDEFGGKNSHSVSADVLS